MQSKLQSYNVNPSFARPTTLHSLSLSLLIGIMLVLVLVNITILSYPNKSPAYTPAKRLNLLKVIPKPPFCSNGSTNAKEVWF